MTLWRFGRLDRPAFGVGSLADYFAAYEAAGGGKVDPARFKYWLVYRTLWWALGCLQMGQAWRSGADTTVQRVVIGRRTAEQALDLIRLLADEDIGRAACRASVWSYVMSLVVRVQL